MKITVDLMISGEVNFFVTMGCIPNCKANRPMKTSAFGDRDDDAFDAAMVIMMSGAVYLMSKTSMMYCSRVSFVC